MYSHMKLFYGKGVIICRKWRQSDVRICLTEMLNMVDYEKLYHILFNAITDALELIEQRSYGSAERALEAAQRRTEELYVENE